MQQCAVYILYFTTELLYLFRVPFTPIIRSTGTVVVDHWYKSYVGHRPTYRDIQRIVASRWILIYIYIYPYNLFSGALGPLK
jgi:transglutaminase-like putative cysteine protease